MNWDTMQDLQYDKDRYHCEHFLIDCYRFLTGIDLSHKLLASGFFNAKNMRNFVEVDKPKQHTIVLFRAKDKAHVGLWYDNKVLHLDMAGVLLQPLEVVKIGFKRVNYYEVI